MTTLCFLLHLFMNSTIFSYQYGLMNICFIFYIKSNTTLFVAQIVAALAPGSSFCWLVCPSSTAINVGVLCLSFEHVLTFWNDTMLQAHLI